MEPKHIGRYDIKSLIGQGGMSTVFLGYDPRSQRSVAIKVLPPYYLHATKFRDRFEREALTITLLEHPAIVPVYDMGDDNGQPYIVMRYMSGGSLAERLRQGAIPLKEVIEMFSRLAQAIDAAHVKGVTHRDVKPDNILFDQYGTVFLSDFGLARLRESLGFAKISDGSIMGTPAYMSPEQIQGDREVDGRSDIYSFGVVLYHMLTGMTPYRGSTAASIMMMHLINPVPHVYEKNPALPTAIQVVLDTSMAKKPEDRYQTAGEMTRVLQDASIGFLNNEQVRPVPNIKSAPAIKPSKISFRTKELDALAVSPVVEQDDTPTKISPPKIKPARRSSQETPSRASTVPPNAVTSITTPQAAVVAEEIPVKKSRLLHWAWIAGVVVLLVGILAIIIDNLDSRASSTQSPASLVSALLSSPVPGFTPLSSPDALQPALILGQADKLAFLKASDIWISNLDGTGLLQLTSDGSDKDNLRWSPDGQSVLFTAANCIYSVTIDTHQVSSLTCLSGVSTIDVLQISLDGKKVAVALDQNDLYLVAYDQVLRLPHNSSIENLLNISTCPSGPLYHSIDPLRSLNWSLDGTRLALLLSISSAAGNHDGVRVIAAEQCSPGAPVVAEILPTYFLFTLRGYYENPVIPGLDWDGEDLLLWNGSLRGDGFGDLHLYSLAQSTSQPINPIQGECCYRDARWSPDRTYILFTFQPEAGGTIGLYYALFAESSQPVDIIGPIPFPADFFADALESIQPALRAVP